MSVIQQRPRQAVVEVFDYMRARGLLLDDLITIGGKDLKSSNLKCVEKARYVEKCWALMVRLSVKFADLASSLTPTPDLAARRRRHRQVFSQVIENKEISTDTPGEVKSLKNNDKTDDHSVGAPGKGRWKHKRRLVGIAS